jgi:hypothetical protein
MHHIFNSNLKSFSWVVVSAGEGFWPAVPIKNSDMLAWSLYRIEKL